MVGFEESEMKQLTLKTGTDVDFFRRGKALAKLADNGAKLPEENIVSFEDPADLLRLHTKGQFGVGDGSEFS